MDPICSFFNSSVADNCLFAPLRRQIDYIFHCKRNARNLKEKVLEKLVPVKNDVNRSIDAAERKGDSIKEEVKAWLAKVSDICKEATELSNGVDKINSWFKGWCCSRYHLGKQAKKKIATVDELLGQEKNFCGVSVPALTPGIESIPTGDFQDFSSRKSVIKEVIEALKNETFNVVGVCGMPGVGKTTLMKEIGKKVKADRQKVNADRLFDEVVMATVSQNPDLINIQDEIAGKLNIKFVQEKSTSGRAAELSTRLKKEKRVLVILDDLWQRLDLTDLGIPLGDDHKGCKVVLTTRSEDVCNHMESQTKIELKVLSEEDSWNLFRQKAGDVVDSPDLQTLAREVVGECKGLPLAIATLGRAMRNKKQRRVWVDASRQLKQNIFNGMSPVFCSIKLSYDCLESEEIKKCFLYCCFFPEDYEISSTDLMPYVMGEELLENVCTLEEAGDRLQTVFDKLIASCLLIKIDEDENGFVTKMHDVVRDTAISLTAKEESKYGFIVKAGLRLERWWSDAKILRTCIRMSLMRTQIDKLPGEPDCPQLLSLSLSENEALQLIPDRFFTRMSSLVTLDLRRTGISLLPQSLSSLENLQVLRLDDTQLSDVSLVVKLKKLKILGLSHTLIEGLPEEIRELTNLRSLDLSRNPNLEIIPQNVLSNLTLLEELDMEEGFSGWEIDEMGDGSDKASLVELESLNYLTKLSLSVGNVNCLSKDILIRTEKLKDFYIRACEEGDHDFQKGRKTMMLTTPSDPLSNWAKALLEKTDDLHLFRCRDLKSVVELDAGGFENLKYLSLEESYEMEYLVSVVETACGALEELEINNMKGLKALYQGPLPNGFLEKLESLEVAKCPKMTNVVPGDLVERLQNLQEIDVKYCKELTEIFQSERQVEGHVDMMVSLKKMILSDLPKLKTIWNVVTTSSTRLIRQSNSCDLATSFPPPPPPLLIFPNLQFLKIWNCNSLNHLFPMKLVRGLKQLQHLDVINCKEMKEIIFVDDDDEVAINNIEEYKKMLPQLETLTLCGLPKLSSFCKQGLLFDWPSLKDLEMSGCPNLKRLPLGAQSAPQLKKFKGENVKWFEGLEWEEQSIKSRLRPLFYSYLQELIIKDMKDLKALYQVPLPNRLHRMKVQRCSKMTNVVPGDLVERLQNLQEIDVKNCKELTEIFQSERQVEGHVDMMVSLKKMILSDLPKLKTIWNVVTTSSTRLILIRQSNSCDLATSFPPPPPPLLIFPNLQFLKIWNCNSLNHLFPMELVRCLKQLRKLMVINCKEMKEIIFVDDDDDVAINNIEEYKKMLPQLETLTLCGLPKLSSFCKQGLLFDWPSLKDLEMSGCPNLKRLPLGAQSAPQLKKFKGDNAEWFEGPEWEEQSINLEFIIEDIEVLKALYQGPLPNRLHRMEVRKCPKMTNVVPGDLVERLQNLQEIDVRYCEELTEIFQSETMVEGQVDMMASLKKMHLWDLPKLKTIWKLVTTSSRQTNSCDLATSFPTPLLIFPNLQYLSIYNCNSLNHLFPMELVRGLKQLQYLDLTNCNEMKEIIFVDHDDEVAVNDVEEYRKMLPQLRYLTLSELPKLSSFCKQGLLFDSPSLESLDILKCPNLKRLPLGAQSALQLKEFSGENVKWFEGLEWEEQSIKSRLLPLFYSNQKFIIEDMEDLKALYQVPIPNRLHRMEVRSCPKVTIVVPGDLVERLQNLQVIKVEDCEELTEIFQSERQVEGHVDMMASLEEMHLESLPKLKTIWKVVTTSSTRLIRQSNYCDLATSFLPRPPPPLLIFPNLQSLYIWNCNSLNHLFPMELVRCLKQLRELQVKNCKEMKEIIFADDDDEVEAINDVEEYKKMLPQLQVLELYTLPKLSSFCKQGLLFDWPSLESLEIQKCRNLKRLPLGAQSALQLKRFLGDNAEWFERLEWEEQSIKSHLRSLFDWYPSSDDDSQDDNEDQDPSASQSHSGDQHPS